jgi:hypothetical protein
MAIITREEAVHAQKDIIIDAWLRNAELKPGIPAHVLVFDLRDQFSRQAVLKICNNVGEPRREELLRVLAHRQNRMQSMFAIEDLFESIARDWLPDYEARPGHFGVLYFGYGGVSLIWLPIPMAADGQNRRL